MLFNELLQCRCHRRRFGGRSFYVEPQTCIKNCLRGSWPETCNFGVILRKLRKILHQRLNSGRTEEYQNIVVYFFQIRQITANHLVNYGFGVSVSCLVKQRGNFWLIDL